MTHPTPDTNHYGIGAVARLTGLSTHILRVWERRYGAVVAERAANGRRYYSAGDVEKLGLLKALTDRGSAISTIANLSLEDLQARAQEMDDIQAQPLRVKPRVAVMGAFLPSLLEPDIAARHGLEVVAFGADPERLERRVKEQKPDTLVLESTLLGDAVLEQLDRLVACSGARHVLLVYGFARSKDEAAARERGARLVRSPVGAEQLAAMVVSTVRDGATLPEPAPAVTAEEDPADPPPPRRYTDAQLLQLARLTDTGIDCECPRHLSQVIQTLGGFEAYSQDCENRNDEDAALHAKLYRSTARARAQMEDALADVLAFEHIKL